MDFNAFKSFTTGNKAIDWVLTRATYTDDSDKYGYNYTAFFSGKLPDRMVHEFRALAKANNNSLYRIDTGEGNYTINIHFTQVQFNGNWNQVKVYATCTENC
jgi:hypothetical protein